MQFAGSAEEAAAVFGEAAVQTIQKQQQQRQQLHAFSSQKFVSGGEDSSQASARSFEDVSSRQLKNTNSNIAKDNFGGYQGAFVSSTAGNQLANCAASGLSLYNTPSPMASQVRYGLHFLPSLLGPFLLAFGGSLCPLSCFYLGGWGCNVFSFKEKSHEVLFCDN